MKSDYVFCVDSDGCVMDTMTYKHKLFFGPLAADVFGIEDREPFLKEWNWVNLYSRTRGINRFVGLVTGLDFAGVANIEKLKHWVESTDSLSNASLEKLLTERPSKDLELALEWSNQVNQSIKNYTGPVLAFIGVHKGLEKLSQLGKVYVVSSANKEAVEEEWTDQSLMGYVTELNCQDRGKKEDVIKRLVDEGYDPNKIMMIGDSPGDLKAAELNKVHFYPILVGQELHSWADLAEKVAEDFVAQRFTTEYEMSLIDTFWKNLDE
ncbi:HAD family hydrolase [Streptococcus ruminantium]|uniref:HAD family hydrolase n=1 Tax=Streptococcus ruminantium TaxID=1917441 RepID=UPI0012DD84C1|nr:HAD hydrolase-like protein [Streptococcus ruminantium]